MTRLNQTSDTVSCPVCVGSGTYFSEEVGDEGGEIVTCITCRGSGRLNSGLNERPCGCRTDSGVFMPCADHIEQADQ